MGAVYMLITLTLLLLAVSYTYQAWVVPWPSVNLARNKQAFDQVYDDPDYAHSRIDGSLLAEHLRVTSGSKYLWVGLQRAYFVGQIHLFCVKVPFHLNIMSSSSTTPTNPSLEQSPQWTRQNSTWRTLEYLGLLPKGSAKRYVIDWLPPVFARHVAVFTFSFTLTEIEIYGPAPQYNVARGQHATQYPTSRLANAHLGVNGNYSDHSLTPPGLHLWWKVHLRYKYKIGAIKLLISQTARNVSILITTDRSADTPSPTSSDWVVVQRYAYQTTVHTMHTAMARQVAVHADLAQNGLNINEMEVFVAYNLAYKRQTSQGPGRDTSAFRAVNGVYDDNTMMEHSRNIKWWKVDLSTEFTVSKVEIHVAAGIGINLGKVTLFTSSAITPRFIAANYEEWKNRSYQGFPHNDTGVVNFTSPIEAQHVALLRDDSAPTLSLAEVVVYEYNYALFKKLHFWNELVSNPGRLAIDGDLQTSAIFKDRWNEPFLAIDIGLPIVFNSLLIYFNDEYCPRFSRMRRCGQIVGNLEVSTSIEAASLDGSINEGFPCTSNNTVVSDNVIVQCDSSLFSLPVARSFQIIFKDLWTYHPMVKVREIEIFGKAFPQLVKENIDWRVDRNTGTFIQVSFRQWSQEDIGSFPPSDYSFRLVQKAQIATVPTHSLGLGQRVVTRWNGLTPAVNYNLTVRALINSQVYTNQLNFQVTSACTDPIPRFGTRDIWRYDKQGWLKPGFLVNLYSIGNCRGTLYHDVKVVDSRGQLVFEISNTTSDELAVDGLNDQEIYTFNVTAKNSFQLSQTIQEDKNLTNLNERYRGECFRKLFRNSAARQSSVRFGERFYYDCNPGYKIDGPNYLICWHNIDRTYQYHLRGNITCIPSSVTCRSPRPGRNTNAIPSPSTLRLHNEKYTYSCVRGAVSSDVLTVTCTGDGTWSSSPPVCRVVTCPTPSEGINTEPVTRSFPPKRYGDHYTYACKTGHDTADELTLICTPIGSWSAAPPVCIAIQCPPLQDGVNTVSVDPSTNRKYLQQYMYTCKVGYKRTTGVTFTTKCEADGEWSAPPPTCEIVKCPTPPEGTNTEAIIPPSVPKTYNERYTYSCLTGYRTSVDLTVTCTADGQWTEPPTCTIQECPPLQDGVNTISVDPSTNREYLQQYTYTCVNGYKIKGNVTFTVRCEENGEWSAPPPTCQVVKCPTPPEGTNTEVVIPPSVPKRYNERYTYSCLTGYRASDELTITCTGGGTWLPSPPTCTVIQCPPLQDGVNTISVDPSTNRKYLQQYTYTCVNGYKIKVNVTFTVRCEENGEWSASPPTCQEIRCQPPANGVNTISVDPGISAPFLEMYTYRCRDGYQPQGNLTVTCGLGGWSPSTLPTCTEIIKYCIIPTIRNAIQITKTSSDKIIPGESVQYECKDGFRHSGTNSSLTCAEDAQGIVLWTGEVSCTKILKKKIDEVSSSSAVVGTMVAILVVSFLGVAILFCKRLTRRQATTGKTKPKHIKTKPTNKKDDVKNEFNLEQPNKGEGIMSPTKKTPEYAVPVKKKVGPEKPNNLNEDVPPIKVDIEPLLTDNENEVGLELPNKISLGGKSSNSERVGPELPNKLVTLFDLSNHGSINRGLAYSKRPTLELPNSRRPTLELPNSKRPTLELPNSKRATLELPNSKRATLELPNSNRVSSELPNIQRVTPELPKSERVTPELPKSERVTPELPKSERVTPEQPNSERVAPELPNSERVTPEQPDNERVTPELPDSERVTPELPDSERVTPEPPDSERVTPELDNKVTADVERNLIKDYEHPKRRKTKRKRK